MQGELAAKVHNERIKLWAGTANAPALGLVGFAILRPLIADPAALDWATLPWAAVGLAMHGAAIYILGRMREESK